MSAENASILAQLSMLGTDDNRFGDYLLDSARGTKLMQGLLVLDPGQTGFKHEDIFAAAQGLCRMAESLLAHLIEQNKGQERIKNVMASGKLLLLLKSGAVVDRKGLNKILGTFYLDWPYAAHWRRDLYRIPAANLTVMALVFGGLQKLRDLLDEQTGLA